MRPVPREPLPCEAVKPDFTQRRTKAQAIPLVTQVRKYELVTPLFGGGVEPGVVDPVTTISGKGIRGQLRFWWRACQGGKPGFGGRQRDMKEVEDLLWGAASTARNPRPSQVVIDVTVDKADRGQPQHPFKVVGGNPGKDGKPKPKPQAQEVVAPAYAAFPLQPTDAEMKAGGVGMATKSVTANVRFTLSLTFPNDASIRHDVEAALWAWETFGGIGARTRRGFGALRLLSLRVDGTEVHLPELPKAGEVEARINKGLIAHVATGTWPPNVPHLNRTWGGEITAARQNSHEAWKYLIDKLRAFRQEEPLARTPPKKGSKHPGRSNWPEPDAIRCRFPSRVPPHSPSLSMPRKFPRAAFGLPIVFKFKWDDEANGDPTKTTLQGASVGQERYASPLILRPLVCADGKAVGLAVILQGSEIPPLMLKDAPGNPSVNPTLTTAEASSVPGGKVDVLRAFLNTL